MWRYSIALTGILGRYRCVLVASILSIFLTQGCSLNSQKSQYSTQLPKVTRGYHIVKEGDTIYQIAWRYGWDYRKLASANKLKKPFVIHPNQKIKLYLSAKQESRQQQPEKQKASGVSVSARSNKNKPRRQPIKSASSRDHEVPIERSSIKWRWPVKGTVLSGFKRNSPLHQGLKIGVPRGSKVRAAGSGTVVYVGAGIRGLEQLIIVEHSNGFLSAYAHNQKIYKKEAEKVKAGEIIAETGSNGSGKAMLHFEIRRRGVSVDPKIYLPLI
ncbi:MAG: peptidoglycan DD-metalloendopeptidase family protein [Pseudomonadales bacterium]|nr:peptidoglycan DD-metalloendopeptidase family protein [Pseudomonadales bacterium]